MLLSLSILGFFLSGMLITYSARLYKSTTYLGVFFFALSTYTFVEYVTLYSGSIKLVSIFFLNFTFLTYLIGPMLYFYIRSSLTDNYRLRKLDFVHFIPMLAFLLSSLPFTLTSYSSKLELAAKIVEDPINVGVLNQKLIVFPVEVTLISRPLLVLGYTIWSGIIFIRYLKMHTESYILPGQNFMKKWLSLLLGFTLILSVVHVIQIYELFIFKNLKIFYTLNGLKLLSGVGLAGLLISPILFPKILYGLPRIPGEIVDSNLDNAEHSSQNLRVVRSQINLEKDYVLYIGREIDTCMKELKPYLNPECNIDYISKLTRIPVHHIAYYFRTEKGQTFTDYRNEWRVRHAKALISEGKADEITMEAIGMLSGFSTRNTFFTVFKKAEGISPGAFASKFTA
jgi:AraC-like DNA-binding protein